MVSRCLHEAHYSLEINLQAPEDLEGSGMGLDQYNKHDNGSVDVKNRKSAILSLTALTFSFLLI